MRIPYEIKLLQRMWKYRQPEIQGVLIFLLSILNTNLKVINGFLSQPDALNIHMRLRNYMLRSVSRKEEYMSEEEC